MHCTAKKTHDVILMNNAITQSNLNNLLLIITYHVNYAFSQIFIIKRYHIFIRQTVLQSEAFVDFVSRTKCTALHLE